MGVIFISLLVPVAAATAAVVAAPVTLVVGAAVVKHEKRRQAAQKTQDQPGPGPRRSRRWLPRRLARKRPDTASPASEHADVAADAQEIEPKQP